MTLEEARNHEGAGVVYSPGHRLAKEDGTIVRCSKAYVFVRYANGSIKATRPEDLELLARTS